MGAAAGTRVVGIKEFTAGGGDLGKLRVGIKGSMAEIFGRGAAASIMNPGIIVRLASGGDLGILFVGIKASLAEMF